MADQMVCSRCNKAGKREQLIKCADCEFSFHFECSSVGSEDVYKKLTTRQKGAWKCDNCKSETSSAKSVRSDTVETTEHSTIVSMFQALSKEVKEGRKETRVRFDGLEKSMDTISISIADFQSRIKDLEEENIQIKERCVTLENGLDEMSRNMSTLQREFLDNQQYMRRDNIEVKGLPQTPQEDVYSILETIAGAIQVPFSRGDVSVAHRVPGKPHPPIIAKFISRQTRDVWLSAARGKRIVASQIAQRFGDQPVFINCHLTGHNKHLLGVAKRMVRERKMVAAWCREDGRILVRKSEGSKSSRVWDEDDLNKLLH